MQDDVLAAEKTPIALELTREMRCCSVALSNAVVRWKFYPFPHPANASCFKYTNIFRPTVLQDTRASSQQQQLQVQLHTHGVDARALRNPALLQPPSSCTISSSTCICI